MNDLFASQMYLKGISSLRLSFILGYKVVKKCPVSEIDDLIMKGTDPEKGMKIQCKAI